MKKFISVFVFLILINLLIPLAYSRFYRTLENLSPDMPQADIYQNETPKVQDDKTVTLLDKASGEVVNIPLMDYLIGVAACEMPASYEEEAIKAQMVAAYSYYLYCAENPGYVEGGYLTFNESTMTSYASKTTLTRYWGTNFYDYYAKFSRCARQVIGQKLIYNNTTALTPYYAVSCGNTRSSGDRWGQDLPYLISVESTDDALSDDYLQIKEMDESDMYSMIKTNFPGVELSLDNPEEWFSQVVYGPGGYAEYVVCGEDKIPADQIRSVFNLPSSCFMFFYEDGVFSLVTKGYGHGVGLSQFGANRMSQKGYTYRQILSHYYPGTQLVNEK